MNGFFSQLKKTVKWPFIISRSLLLATCLIGGLLFSRTLTSAHPYVAYQGVRVSADNSASSSSSDLLSLLDPSAALHGGKGCDAGPQDIWQTGKTGSGGVVFQGDPHNKDKDVAITIDDGPSMETPNILKVLEDNNAHATFFVEGQFVTQHPDLVKQEQSDGDAIGDHTEDHKSFTGESTKPSPDAQAIRLSDKDIKGEIKGAYDAINDQLGGNSAPKLFRAPYGDGATDPTVQQDVSDLSMMNIGWTIDSCDYNQGVDDAPSATDIANNVINSVNALDGSTNVDSSIKINSNFKGSGAIVLMHDGGGDRHNTTAALKLIIPELQKEGYNFVTVQDMIDAGNFAD